MFDKIGSDDLVLAFFPCIHFSQFALMFYRCETWHLRNYPHRTKTEYAIDKMKECSYFFGLIKKLECIAIERGLKLIVENPWTFSMLWLIMRKPDIIDTNRHKHGDYFTKPTAYWFYNFKPTASKFQNENDIKTLHKTIEKSKSAPMAGLCSEERSMISPSYARNFICNFILGKSQHNTQLNLFE